MLLPKVKLKSLVSFPAAVYGGAGVNVRKENGNFFFDLGFDDFAPPASGLVDPGNLNALLWNKVNNSYVLSPISLFGGSGGIPDAPNDGALYGRQSAAWAAIQPTAYNTVAHVQASFIASVVVAVRTAGYWAAGDGGGALYSRVASEPSHAGKIQSADGAWWVIDLRTGVVNIRSFGAKDDGVYNCAPAINAAIEAVRSTSPLRGGRVYVPAANGAYRIASPIIMPPNLSMFGDEGFASYIFCDNTDGIVLSYVTGLGNAVIHGICLVGDSTTAHTAITVQGDLNDTTLKLYGVTISNCLILHWNVGILFINVINYEIFNVWIQYINQGIRLFGQTFAGRIVDSWIIYADGAPGFNAGTDIYRTGINLGPHFYSVQNINGNPEGAIIDDMMVLGFEVPLLAQTSNWLVCTNTDFSGTVMCVSLGAVNNGFLLDNCYCELTKPTAVAGIFAVGTFSAGQGKTLITNNTFIATDDYGVQSGTVGIKINGAGTPVPLSNVLISGNEIISFKANDIWVTQGNNIRIAENLCLGTVPADSIYVDPVIGGRVQVVNNDCKKEITVNQDDLGKALVTVTGNTRNGGSVDPNGHRVRVAASSNALAMRNGTGWISIRENDTTGEAALFFVGYFGVGHLVSQTGTKWSFGTVPAASGFSLGYDSGTTSYRIYSAVASPLVFNVDFSLTH